MNVEEIKNAVDQGKTVYWNTEDYSVIKDEKGRYRIVFKANEGGSGIGLTWTDGYTLNGKEKDFFLKDPQNDHNVIDTPTTTTIYFITLTDEADETAYFVTVEEPAKIEKELSGIYCVHEASHYIDCVEDKSEAAQGALDMADYFTDLTQKGDSVRMIKTEIFLTV